MIDPRRFYLQRDDDETGVSGTGRVADGIEFDNGKAVLCWNSRLSSVAVYDSVHHIERIHGHQGRTRVVWIDES